MKFSSFPSRITKTGSLPAWGEWIEILSWHKDQMTDPSLPAWGEWIEIATWPRQHTVLWSLPAWGEWIEIGLFTGSSSGDPRLSPHGESGLK